MDSVMAGFVIFICIKLAVIYENVVRPKWGDPTLRAVVLVIALWIFAVSVRLVFWLIERFA